MRMRQRGFTLVELVIVIVLIGAVGAMFAMMLQPTMRGYVAASKRAALTDAADTALRRVLIEVRAAVPNSLRLANARCLELVPTVDGGRYRTGPDVTSDRSGDAFLDHGLTATAFDVTTPFTREPLVGDLVVIGNQNPDDVYSRSNLSTITTVSKHSGTDAWKGSYRLGVTPTRIPFGYEGGRFLVVPGGEQAVSFVCFDPTNTPGGVDASGRGTSKLYRITRDIASTQSCSVPANAPVLASNVARCEFIYSPNQGATQQSGFIQLQLTLADGGESAPLTLGAHVSNVP